MDKHIYVRVFLAGIGFVPAGIISFNTKLNTSIFKYFSSYIENKYPPINPSTLNWKSTKKIEFELDTIKNNQLLDRTFWELLPNETDWSNQVLESIYPGFGNMPHVEKLFNLGNRVVGGLHSYKDDILDEESIKGIEWLEKIHDESIDFYLKNIKQIKFVKFIKPLTTYGGVRPKCMFEDENGELWIAKFNLPTDPYDIAIGEQIALDIARDIGLTVSESKVIQLPNGSNVFLSKRFDRQGNKRQHSLSLFSLSPGNEIIRNKDHGGNPGTYIFNLIIKYTDFASVQAHEVITKLLLDLAINNTDNHLRNTRIILDENNKWRLAPIYDTLFNPNNQLHTYNPANLPQAELFLNNPNLISHMAKEYGFDKDFLYTIISKIKNTLKNIEKYFIKYNATEKDRKAIEQAISLGLNRKEKLENRLENKKINKPLIQLNNPNKPTPY